MLLITFLKYLFWRWASNVSKHFTNSSNKIEPDDTMESSPAEMIPSYCQANFLAENTEEIN